mgnify:CR=1 FL=1
MIHRILLATAERIFTMICIVLLVVSCSSRTVVESDMGISDAPEWVNEGTNTLKDKNGRLFHGVGSAPSIGEQSLQMSTADDRARAEVAKILSSYMNVVSKDYVGSAGFSNDSSAEQTITRNIENMTKINMTGTRIIGRWKDEKTKIIYSIAELDMSHVKKTLNTVESMSPEFRQHFSQKSDRLFDNLLAGEK